MNEFGGLIERISIEFNIKKDIDETEEMWKSRVVYSVAGRLAMASLYDVLEDEKPVSVTYFKRRCKRVFEAYLDLYPGLRHEMLAPIEDYTEEIYHILLGAGCIYHTPNRLIPSAEMRVTLKNVELQRGTAVGEMLFVSGIGTYQIRNGNQPIDEVLDMFQIPAINLSEYGQHLVRNAKWCDFETKTQVEYLRIEPPFTRGYWKDTPDMDGKVALLRTGEQGGYLYYLYRYENGKKIVSELPSWMVDGAEYRNISNALLAANGSLPSIKIETGRNKKTVLIKQEYLLPIAVMNFVKLYSWPARFSSVHSDFNRVMTKDVYDVLKEVFQIIGIEVKENV